MNNLKEQIQLEGNYHQDTTTWQKKEGATTTFMIVYSIHSDSTLFTIRVNASFIAFLASRICCNSVACFLNRNSNFSLMFSKKIFVLLRPLAD